MSTTLSFRLLLILAAILYAESLSRPEITAQYRKTLQRLQTLADLKSSESSQKYNLLYNETRNNHANIVNRTQIHINLLKTSLSDAIKVNSGAVLNCLRNLQTDAGRLSTSSLSVCISNGNFSVLNTIQYRFKIVSSLSTNTVYYCQQLNPLDSQDEPYQKCVVDKIVDLNDQINIIEQDFNRQRNGTSLYTIGCLTQNAGNIFAKITAISYEINMCIFGLNLI